MGKGGGSSKNANRGFSYEMVLHMGLCRGPVDMITAIDIGGKRAWNATGGMGRPNDMGIDAPNLFGGGESEGGIVGHLHMMHGNADQFAHSILADAMQMPQHLLPGFRGVTTAVWDGVVAQINPYPKPWKFRVRRVIQGWEDAVWQIDLAQIPMADSQILAMNPAHILYECLTNYSWGRGIPTSRLDNTAWTEAAVRLHTENFGLCVRWTRQDSLQEFIQNIIEHIGGALFVDRRTGLIRLDLIRDDYDVNTLPAFTYGTGLLEVVEEDVAARENAVNEVVVNYKSPITGNEEQAREHNLAGIQAAGAVCSVTKSYLGVPTYDLARRLAARELRVQGTGIRRLKLRMDRRAWTINPASVFVLQAPERGISHVVMRVGRVQDGDVKKGDIIVDCIVDIFGFPHITPATVPPAWVPPDTSAQVASVVYFGNASYRDLYRYLGLATLATLANTSGFVRSVAMRPSSLATDYELAVRAAGEAAFVRQQGLWAPTFTTTRTIAPHETEVPISGALEAGNMILGAYQWGSEVVRLNGYNIPGNTINVSRGCEDTIPVGHATSDRLIQLDGFTTTDSREYALYETAEAKVLTRSSSEQLTEAEAPTLSAVISNRWLRPYPPAYLEVDGTLWFHIAAWHGIQWPLRGDLPLTWRNRNRVAQQDTLIDYTGATVGPETGQETVLTMTRVGESTPVRTYVAPQGHVSYDYTSAAMVADGTDRGFRLTAVSTRDGLASSQGYDFKVYPELLGGGILGPGTAITRGSVARDRTLPWTAYAANVPRFIGATPRLLVEGSGANQIDNPRVVGGAAGTMPTGWYINASGNGITRTVVGTTVINGVDCLLIDLSGTATGNYILDIQVHAPSEAPAAASGEPWVIGYFASVVSGSVTGLAIQQVFYEFTPAFAVSGAHVGGVKGFTSTLTRFSDEVLLNGSGTTRVQQRIVVQIPVGHVFSTTLRIAIGWPHMERNALFASTPMVPDAGATGVALRHTDIVTASLPSPYAAKGAIGGEFVVTRGALNMTRGLISVDNGASTHRLALRILPNEATIKGGRRVAGADALSGLAVTLPVGAPFRAAMSWDAASGVVRYAAGGTVVSHAGGVPSGLNRAIIGNGAYDFVQPLYDEVSWARTADVFLSEAELAAYTA